MPSCSQVAERKERREKERERERKRKGGKKKKETADGVHKPHTVSASSQVS